MTEKEADKSKLKSKYLILSFVIPFVAVMAIWTTWDYCDISDGIDKGRSGPEPNTSDQTIFVNSFKESFEFAIPAGLIGLGCGFAVFRRSGKNDSST